MRSDTHPLACRKQSSSVTGSNKVILHFMQKQRLTLWSKLTILSRKFKEKGLLELQLILLATFCLWNYRNSSLTSMEFGLETVFWMDSFKNYYLSIARRRIKSSLLPTSKEDGTKSCRKIPLVKHHPLLFLILLRKCWLSEANKLC